MNQHGKTIPVQNTIAVGGPSYSYCRSDSTQSHQALEMNPFPKSADGHELSLLVAIRHG